MSSHLIRFFAVLRGVIYAALFASLWWWIVVSVRPLDSSIVFSVPDWMRLPGLFLVVSGILLGLWCVGVFAWFGKGTPAPFDSPREFVATGPYRYTRNPMYIGAISVIIGAGFILRSPSALLVAVCFLFLAHMFILVYEEPALQNKFGESYLQYKRNVNRWLPGKGWQPEDSGRN